jgi:hypothetical protein
VKIGVTSKSGNISIRLSLCIEPTLGFRKRLSRRRYKIYVIIFKNFVNHQPLLYALELFEGLVFNYTLLTVSGRIYFIDKML